MADFYWPRLRLARSIKTKKDNLANIQASLTHALSTTHMYLTSPHRSHPIQYYTLPHFILPTFHLSYILLSSLSHLILARSIWHHPISCHLISSHLISSHLIPSHLTPSHIFPSHLIPPHPIFTFFLSHFIPSDLNSLPFNQISSHPILPTRLHSRKADFLYLFLLRIILTATCCPVLWSKALNTCPNDPLPSISRTSYLYTRWSCNAFK